MIECIFRVPVKPGTLNGVGGKLPAGAIVQRTSLLFGPGLAHVEVVALCPPPEPFEVAGMKIG